LHKRNKQMKSIQTFEYCKLGLESLISNTKNFLTQALRSELTGGERIQSNQTRRKAL